jgi:elongation factor G
MKREFKVEVNQGEPQVEYKEAFTKTATHRETYKKQSGGRGKFGDIVFRVEPADEVDGKVPVGLQFVNEVKGGNVPKEYIPAVEKGFREAMKTGPLAGYQVDSLKVTLLGPKPSSARFMTASSYAASNPKQRLLAASSFRILPRKSRRKAKSSP